MSRFIAYSHRSIDSQESHMIARSELALAQARRSVRYFSDRPVPRSLIDTLLEIAGTAPSGANLQPWHFVVVGSSDIKKRIREAAEETEREFYDRRATPEWLEALAPLGTDWQKPFLEIAPWLIVVFRRRWEERGGRRFKTYYSTESVGIAVGFLITAIHRVGLVTLTHTPAPMGFLRDICQRPDSETPFVLLPVGYPAEGCKVPDIQRKPLRETAQYL